ncbi:hypothetical protein P3T76_014254 [Phytophthora citrophthora]|uniref:Uncharacterized protein n=1 Tax=Phytophthora citrophthora TaxID=4793 RepID=A0AAD9LCH2_9STRA|nr:hypothetical protein P3T76_014254 [Phytophthora citrophthora]
MDHYTTRTHVEVSPREFAAWNSRPMLPHEDPRHYERACPSVRFHDGMPFIPWTALQDKIPKADSRKLTDVVVERFNAKRLIVSGHTSELPTDPVQNNGAAYLSLERALGDTGMKECVKKTYSDWDTDTPVEVQPAEYEHNPGLLYSPEATPGLYALYFITTQSYTDGPVVVGKETFVMKAGRSYNITRRFEDHRTGSDFSFGGEGRFLFGIAVTVEGVPRAEGMLHAKMTQFGFAWPMVTSFPKRTCDTYKYSSISLPLIHYIFCKRCVVPPPSTPPLPPLPHLGGDLPKSRLSSWCCHWQYRLSLYNLPRYTHVHSKTKRCGEVASGGNTPPPGSPERQCQALTKSAPVPCDALRR